MEGFTCKLKNILPVEEWAKVDDEENCPPCLISPLASYYMGALKASGESDKANQLQKVYEDGDLLTICKELDKIKGQVGEALRAELKDLDCFAQSFKLHEDAD